MGNDQRTRMTGAKLWDNRGVKVGRIEDVVVDEQTLKPRWAVVTYGLRNRRTLIPVDCLASTEDGAITALVDRDVIRHAPRLEGDPLRVAERAERYYRTA